jgi:hypothetical protein
MIRLAHDFKPLIDLIRGMMIACIFSSAFTSKALLQGSCYFLIFLTILLTINWLIDQFGSKKGSHLEN